MILGTVTARKEIVISIQVRDSAGRPSTVSAIVDTGFSGALTLPPAIIAALKLPRRSTTRAVLANGTVQRVKTYTGTVVWDGRDRLVLVYEVKCHPLAGMTLLEDHQLRASIQLGGVVEIEELP